MKPVFFLFAGTLLPGLALAQATADSAQPESLPPIIVTADPFDGRTPVEALQPTEVLAADDLERARAQTLGDSLQTLPGVHSSDFGAGASRPVIRGQGGPRVRILDGGVGVIDASVVSPDHNAAVEPFRARQIEVLKGPATLLYGSGAIGGVVNIVSDLLPSMPIQGLSGSVGGSLSSVDEGETVFGHVEGGNGTLAFHLDGLTRRTSDYDIPGIAELEDEEHEGEAHAEEEQIRGRVPNTFTKTDSVAAGLSWTMDGGFIAVGVSSYDTLYGVPGHGHGHEEEHADEPATPRKNTRVARLKSGEGEEEGVSIDLRQRRYELRAGLDQPLGWLERARGSVVVTDYRHIEIEPEEAHAETLPGVEVVEEEEEGTIFANDGVEVRLELTHKPLAGWRGVFGFQGSTEEFSAIGEEAFVPPVDTTSTALFLVEEREFGSGRFSIGGRVENVDHDPSGTNPARDFDLFSLALGWNQPLGDRHRMRLGMSLAERAPDVLELYADGPHFATQTIEFGNPDLRKERSLNFDIGHSGQRDQWFYAADVFYTVYSDYIFAEEFELEEEPHTPGEPEGEHAHEDEELTPIRYVQEDADFYGAEVEVGYQFMGAHSVALFADSVRVDRKDGGRLPRIPADRIGLRFDGGVGAWSYGLRAIRVLAQDRATESEGRTAGYTLVGADLEYLLALSTSEVAIALRGRNLLDEEARNHVSFLKRLAPLPGANVKLDLEWRF